MFIEIPVGMLILFLIWLNHDEKVENIQRTGISSEVRGGVDISEDEAEMLLDRGYTAEDLEDPEVLAGLIEDGYINV